MKLLLPYEAFKYDLNIKELKLLLVLSSYKNIKIDELEYKIKMWIAGSRSNCHYLKNYEKRLNELGLINKEREYGDYKIYKNLEPFNKSKNMRQLFLNSFRDVYVSEEIFKNIFGKKTYIINDNFNRTCEEIGMNFTWTKTKDKRIRITRVTKTYEISVDYVDRGYGEDMHERFDTIIKIK